MSGTDATPIEAAAATVGKDGTGSRDGDGGGDGSFRLATPADRARVCATIGAAFVDAASPEMTYFFGAERFAELAPIFAGTLFDKRVGRSTVWVADDCSAAALWDAPEEPPPAAASAAAAAAAAPSSAPAATSPLPLDVQERLDRYDDVVHELLPPQPYWYLGILARAPSLRGSGVGRRLTRPALALAAAHTPTAAAVAAGDNGGGGQRGVPAVLETTNPLNVAAYGRAGWTVHATSDALQPAMRIWVMRYDHASAAAALPTQNNGRVGSSGDGGPGGAVPTPTPEPAPLPTI
jgi:GNAT superfamily N-acetyltransferase|eukprot:COSAG01_NODE_12816_length_1681_cov_1.992415_1_plen_293_part_00